MTWTAKILSVVRDGSPGKLFVSYELSNGTSATKHSRTVGSKSEIYSMIQSEIAACERVDGYLAEPVETGVAIGKKPEEVKPPPPEEDTHLRDFMTAYDAFLSYHRAVTQGIIKADDADYLAALAGVKAVWQIEYLKYLRD